MVIYSTRLKINNSLTIDKFLELVVTWNQQHSHEANKIKDLVWNGEYTARFGDEKLGMEFLEYAEEKIEAVRYKKVDNEGIIWTTDYIMNFQSMEMQIQLEKSFSETTQVNNNRFSPPFFIKHLIDAGYLSDDYDLPVLDTPIIVDRDNLSIVVNLLNGTGLYALPVVYVAKEYDGSIPIDAEFLASRVKGIAHVLVQEDAGITKELAKICDKGYKYGASVDIVFPGNMQDPIRLFNLKEYGYSQELFDRALKEIVQFANKKIVDTMFTWDGVNIGKHLSSLKQTTSELNHEKQARQKAENDSELAERKASDTLEMAAEESENLENKIKELNREIAKLTTENEALKNKAALVNSVPVIFEGKEKELFEGETREIVLYVLKKAIKNTEKPSRIELVLKSILEANKFNGEMEKIEKNLELISRHSKEEKQVLELLTGIGFVLKEQGRHYKLWYRNDARYSITVPKTGSDYREGENLSSQIKNKLL